MRLDGSVALWGWVDRWPLGGSVAGWSKRGFYPRLRHFAVKLRKPVYTSANSQQATPTPFSDFRCHRCPRSSSVLHSSAPSESTSQIHTWNLDPPSPDSPFLLRSLFHILSQLSSAQLNELQMHSSQPSPSRFIPKPLILVQRARASSLHCEVENLTRAVEQKVLLAKRSLPSLPPSPRSEPQIAYFKNGRPLTGHSPIESYAIVSIFSLLFLMIH